MRGFTLIEMLVTVAIVGLLASISVPMLELVSRRNNEQNLREALRQIRTALDAYKQAVDEGRVVEESKGSGYPPSLDVLVNGVVDAKSPNKSQKIFFLRRIPNDPFLMESSDGTTAGWGVRSYASPQGNPQPGIDVFDVYSRAEGVGLNGIAYKDW